jgi:hypothetical protein
MKRLINSASGSRTKVVTQLVKGFVLAPHSLTVVAIDTNLQDPTTIDAHVVRGLCVATFSMELFAWSLRWRGTKVGGSVEGRGVGIGFLFGLSLVERKGALFRAAAATATYVYRECVVFRLRYRVTAVAVRVVRAVLLDGALSRVGVVLVLLGSV